ncbi:MAG: hypothetical protein IJS90_03635, partial [Clostridia bacterium]|nr:hypothetical protein [Clostridia bacterium]
DADEGFSYDIQAGKEISSGPAGCPVGTTIIVKDLFYNVPARLKFLKKDVTEGNYISDIITKIAVSRPDVKFTFIRDEKRVFGTPGNGDLFACLHAVFGKEVTDMLLPCSGEYEKLKISGFISKPLGNRPNRNMQYFFVNGRYVRIPAAAPALDRAYKNSIMVGKFPMCFLRVELSPELTDVNVHPAKTEIRFSDESKIYEAVFYSARAALAAGDRERPEVTLHGKKSILDEPEKEKPRQLSFEVKPPVKKSEAPAPAVNAEPASSRVEERVFTVPEKKYDIPAFSRSAAPKAPSIDIAFSEDDAPAPKPLILHDGTARVESLPRQAAARVESELPEAPTPETEPPARNFASEFASLKEEPRPESKENEPVRAVGEVFGTYIIAEQGNKLFVIDKHASHERIIFNSLGDIASSGSQMLLSPAAVSLSGREYAAVIENIKVFSDAGYEIEDFGSSSVLVRSCPAVLTNEDVPAVIKEMAGKLLKGDLRPVPEKLDWLKNSTACKAAVRAGDKMSLVEMQALVEKVLFDDSIRYCPHGRPVLYELSKYELEKQFGRTT